MDGHNKVAKAIRNGVFDLPTDILTAKCGKLPKFKYGKKEILGDFNTAMTEASELADTMREKNTQFKTPWEQSTGGINKYWTDSDRLARITPIKSEESPTPYDSSRWNNWGL